MRIFGCLLLGALLAACASSPPPPAAATAPNEATPAQSSPPAGHVDAKTAHALVGSGARLIDVRSPEEFAGGHIEGAESVPVATVDAAELGPKDSPLVLYCASGARAARAATVLRAKGYTRVYELGAMSSWKGD